MSLENCLALRSEPSMSELQWREVAAVATARRLRGGRDRAALVLPRLCRDLAAQFDHGSAARCGAAGGRGRRVRVRPT